MIKKYLFIRETGADSPTSGTPVLIGVASEEQIKEWKEKYKEGIYGVVSDGHIAYFRNPNRTDMNIAMSKASSDAALDMYEQFAKITKIGGSEELLTNDTMFLGLLFHFKNKMDGKKGQLVNL